MELPKNILKTQEDLKRRTSPAAVLKFLPNLLKALENDKKTFPYISKLKNESAKLAAHNGLNWHEDLESDPVTLYRFFVFHAGYGSYKPLVSSQENWPRSDEEAIALTQQVHISMYLSSFAEPDPDQIFPNDPPYSCERLLQLVDIFLGMVSIGICDKARQENNVEYEINKDDHWRTKDYKADLITLIPLFEQVRRDHPTSEKVPRSKLIPLVKALVKQRGIILNNATESLYDEASKQGDYRKQHPRGPGHS